MKNGRWKFLEQLNLGAYFINKVKIKFQTRDADFWQWDSGILKNYGSVHNNKLDKNRIGAEGCHNLIQNQWRSL